MKLKITILPVFCLVVFTSVFAQDKLFSYNDFLNWGIYPESVQNIGWRGSTDNFTYVADDALLQQNATNPDNFDTLMKLEDLKIKHTQLDDLRRIPGISWIDDQQFYFTSDHKIFVYDFEKDSLALVNEYPEEAENVEVHTGTFSVAYTIDNNLYVSIDGRQIAVSNEDNEDILYGHVPSRNEFGISHGSFWSPDGKKLAFYQTDQTEVAKYPNVDIFNRIAEPDPIAYPMAGEKSQIVKLGIFDPAINQITWIRTPGPQNQYLTSVSWEPDGKMIIIGLLNRDQNHLTMNRYNVTNGKLANLLFEESNARYVEPSCAMTFLKNNTGKYIWQSRKDGWNHMYLGDQEKISQLTKGNWEVTSLLGFDEDESHVYFTSTAASPLERQLYSANLKNGKIKRITTDAGTHQVIPSADKKYFIDIFSSTEMARAYYVIDDEGKVVTTLQEDKDPWEEYKTGEMEIFTIKADDEKTDLFCRLIKPVDFDPAKKYPALVYVYGGPHAQLITNSWTGGAGFWLNLMAQQGYVVFTLDNRGSANRGFEFESIIHRQCGEKEMADQLAGVEYLKSLDYVDSDRIGVDGWSYGGFLTTSLMLRNPGVFKVACAGGPVIDWKWYEVMYGERYMDTPMENAEGYEKANVLNYVDQLEGKMLIIHGTNDPVVMWQNSLTLLDECIKHGKQVDYFVYPGAGHNMRGKSRVHMFEKITAYFNAHLK